MPITRTLNAGYNEPIIVNQDNNASSFTASLNISAGNMKSGTSGYVEVRTNPTQIVNESITSTPFSIERDNEGELSKVKFEYLNGTNVEEDTHLDGIEVQDPNFVVHANLVGDETDTDSDIKLSWSAINGDQNSYTVPLETTIDPDVDVNTNQVDNNEEPIAPNTYLVHAFPIVNSTELEIKEVNLAPSVKDYTYKGRSDYVYVVKKVFVKVEGTEGKGLCHHVPYCASFETIKAAVNDNSTAFCEHINKDAIDEQVNNTLNSIANREDPKINNAYDRVVRFSVDERFANVPDVPLSVNVRCDIEYTHDEFNGINIINMWQALQTKSLTRTISGRRETTTYYIVNKTVTTPAVVIGGVTTPAVYAYAYKLKTDSELVILPKGNPQDLFGTETDTNMNKKFNFAFSDNNLQTQSAIGTGNAPAIENKEFHIRRNVAHFVNNATNESLYSVKSYNSFRFSGINEPFVNGHYFNIKGYALVSIYISDIVKRIVEKLGCVISWNKNFGGDYIAPLAKAQTRCYEFTVMPNGKNNENRLVLSDFNNKSDEMVFLRDSNFGIITNSLAVIPDKDTYKYVLTAERKSLYTKIDTVLDGRAYRLNANPNIVVKFKSSTESPIDNLVNKKGFEIESITFEMAGLENMMRFRIVNILSAFNVALASNKAVDSGSSNTYLILTNTDDVCNKNTTVSCLHQSLNPSVWDSKLDWNHSLDIQSGNMNIYL